MKALFKFIIGLVVTVVLLGVAGIAGVYIFIINDEDIANKEIIEKDYSVETVINNEICEALIGAKESKDVSFLLSTYQLEQILYAVTKTLDDNIEDFTLRGLKVECIENQYTVFAAIQYKTFPTQLSASLILKEENGTFTIGISKIKLSKIELLGSWTKSLLENIKDSIDDVKDQLETELKIYVDFDLDNLSIILTKENILKTLDEYVDQIEPLAIVRLLSSIFLNKKELLEFNFGKDELLGAILHLATLEYNIDTNGPLPYTYDFDKIIEQEEQLLTESTIKFEDVNVTFKYLVNGYSALEDEEKSTIDEIDFTSIGIYAKSLYPGIIGRDNKPLSEKINDTLSLLDIQNNIISGDNSFSINITEDMLNSLINSTNFIGIGNATAHSETNKIGYFIIDQMFIRTHENSSTLYLILNIHDVQIYLEVELDCHTTTGYRLKGIISKASLGTNGLTEQQVIDLLSFLKLTLASSNTDWISIDPEAKEISFDFEQEVLNSSIVATLLSYLPGLGKSYEVSTSFYEDYVQVKYSLI